MGFVFLYMSTLSLVHNILDVLIQLSINLHCLFSYILPILYNWNHDLEKEKNNMVGKEWIAYNEQVFLFPEIVFFYSHIKSVLWGRRVSTIQFEMQMQICCLLESVKGGCCRAWLKMITTQTDIGRSSRRNQPLQDNHKALILGLVVPLQTKDRTDEPVHRGIHMLTFLNRIGSDHLAKLLSLIRINTSLRNLLTSLFK